LHTFQQQVLVDIVNVGLLLREDHDGGWRLLQALEEVDNLGFGLDILHLLDNVEVGRASAPDVDGDGLDERTAGKV
jgi:hypothetical protein